MNELSLETRSAWAAPAKEQRVKEEPALPALVVSGRPVPASGSEVPATRRVEPTVAPKQMDRAVAVLNDFLQSQQRDLVFSLDAELGRPVVRVLDSSTQEVIRQLPSEVALRLARNVKAIRELMEGEAQSGKAGGYRSAGAGAQLHLLDSKV